MTARWLTAACRHAAAVLYGLFFYAFPWISEFVNPQEVTVE